ncbi:MAG: TM2 domain-containing protein [bacterium]
MEEQGQSNRRKILTYIPDMEFEELAFLQRMLSSMADSTVEQFLMVYSQRRKKSMIVLLLTLLGFFCAAGIQRFYIGHIGMGVLYLFTGGLCFIGTIVDLVNYKRLALEENIRIAQQTAMMITSL